jgi:nitrate/TMAO reductase-like tetraheme cytochrome c subunit
MRLPIQIAAATIFIWHAWAPSAEAAAAGLKYSEEGAKACLDCHETDHVMGIMKTAHGKVEDPKTPAATRECQSCHGPSAKHMMFPMQVENVHFGKKSTSDAVSQNVMCLECHHDGHRENWKAGAHGFEKIVCSTCHSMHDPEKVVLSGADVKTTCVSSGCHDKMLKEAEPVEYTHALGKDLSGKGELTCSGCHNPHGPLESGRCIECHAQTPEVLAKETEKAKRFHEVAATKGTSCIRCHKGIAHPIRPLALEESRIEMEKYGIHD